MSNCLVLYIMKIIIGMEQANYSNMENATKN